MAPKPPLRSRATTTTVRTLTKINLSSLAVCGLFGFYAAQRGTGGHDCPPSTRRCRRYWMSAVAAGGRLPSLWPSAMAGMRWCRRPRVWPGRRSGRAAGNSRKAGRRQVAYDARARGDPVSNRGSLASCNCKTALRVFLRRADRTEPVRRPPHRPLPVAQSAPHAVPIASTQFSSE